MSSILHYRNSIFSRRAKPEVSLVVSTYQKPQHLQLSLASIALQQGVLEKLESVVTDDGSTDSTLDVVEQFAASVEFPVTLTTHPHRTFQLAKCRNEGVAVSQAPYLIFVDGDLILPPDFVEQHLQRRRSNVAYTGDCYRVTEAASAGIDEATVRRGKYRDLLSNEEVRRLQKVDRLARWQAFVRHPHRPHLKGGNVGLWRSDFERVHGYDENFQGWGFEDDDLSIRLRRAGVRIHSINRWTSAFHVWHPRDITAPAAGNNSSNLAYYLSKHRQVCSPMSNRLIAIPVRPANENHEPGRPCRAA